MLRAVISRGLFALSIGVLTAVAVACGGEDTSASTATEPSGTAAPEQVTTTGTPEVEESETTSTVSGGDDGADESSVDAALEGGNATLTIAGDIVEFDFFVCFSGAAAVEFFGADDLTFGAVGQGQDETGATVTVAVSSVDSPFGANYTIFYARADPDGEQSWQMVGTDAAQVDGDRVTGQGDFSRIVDNQPSDQTDPGSLEATCSPNSR